MAKRDCNTTDFAHLTQANGRTLAVEMLARFRRTNADALSIEARYRTGKPQKDIIGLYQRTMKAAGNPAVEAGFRAVLNDFIAHALTTGVMEPEFYAALDDAEIGRGFTEAERGDGIDSDDDFAPITRGHLTLVHSLA